MLEEIDAACRFTPYRQEGAGPNERDCPLVALRFESLFALPRCFWSRGDNTRRSGRPTPLYSTITQSLLPRPKTSGEYISSALVGGTTNLPGVVARAT
jgi:hypothetical protein